MSKTKILVLIASILTAAILIVGVLLFSKESTSVVNSHQPHATPSASAPPRTTSMTPADRRATPIKSDTAAPAPEAPAPIVTQPVTPKPSPSIPPAPPKIVTPPAPVLPSSSSADENTMLALVNSKRAAANLPPLSLNAKLTSAAAEQASYQASINTMTHEGNGGLGARITAQGYRWCSAAENVAEGYPTAKAVFVGWVNSPGHLANILSDNTEMGLAVSTGSDGNLYWAQDFGKPC